MPRETVRFESQSTRRSGDTVTTTITVSGGEIDTSLFDRLKDVTLTRVNDNTYEFTTRGATRLERAIRTAQVYNALLNHYRGEPDRLKALIEADAER